MNPEEKSPEAREEPREFQMPAYPGPPVRDTILPAAPLPVAPSPEPSPPPPIPAPAAFAGFPLWFWFGGIALVLALFWGVLSWFQEPVKQGSEAGPFFRVTNRQMSLFLWENPEFMRVRQGLTQSYLPAFEQADRMKLDPTKADEWAVAPTDILFRYHVWDRLLSQERFPRPIPPQEFRAFLEVVPEWNIKYWLEAPPAYDDLVKSLLQTQLTDLSVLPETTLPHDVRRAFFGWKNFYQEKSAIEHVSPTFQAMKQFLEAHPPYGRSYWRNIVADVAPNYLKELNSPSIGPQEIIPSDEMALFLRTAFFNSYKASEETSANPSS